VWQVGVELIAKLKLVCDLCCTIYEKVYKTSVFFSTTATTCNPSPCGAHGVCLEAILPTGPTAYCNCQDRWTGKYCDVNMDGRYHFFFLVDFLLFMDKCHLMF
jgi:hypothetical protein